MPNPKSVKHGCRLLPAGPGSGIAWRAKIETTGEWQIIDLAFVDFDPVFRGRKIADAGAVVAASIGQIGFMLADKRAGPFSLEIRSMEFR